MEAHLELTIKKRHFNVCVPMSIIFFFVAFYAKIQDSWENDFWGKSQVDSADTLWVKSFVKITLSRSVSEINTFLAFYAEIQNGHQKRWENDLWQKSPVYSADTLWVKHFIALIHPIQWTIAYSVGAEDVLCCH